MFRRHRDKDEFRDQPADQVKNGEPQPPDDVFHARAEQEQKNHVPQQMENSRVNKHRGKTGIPGAGRGNEPEMLQNPQVRCAVGAEEADGRDEPGQRVEADERQGDERKPFGPVIHSDWNGDEHDALGRAQ
jgi:hypothetical protein